MRRATDSWYASVAVPAGAPSRAWWAMYGMRSCRRSSPLATIASATMACSRARRAGPSSATMASAVMAWVKRNTPGDSPGSMSPRAAAGSRPSTTSICAIPSTVASVALSK
ncbi:MAG: hypothetical protein V9E89_08300 [Ilumatobacteraceae bacterium]